MIKSAKTSIILPLKSLILVGILAFIFILIGTACNSAKETIPPSPPIKAVNNFNGVEILQEGFIYENAPFPECHASSIVELENGKIMATWFGGTREKHPDVTIWLSIFENGKWGAIQEIADGIENDTLRYPCWNPVLFKNKAGKLFLFYKVGPNPRDWWGMMKTSIDDGKTWSYAEKLPKNRLGPIRAKPIELANGDLLCPSSVEFKGGYWRTHMEIYQPKLNFWKKIDIDPNTDFDVIQPTILRHSDTQLQILCRSRQNKIIEAWSNDNGQTWGKLGPTNLPNPSAGIDAITLPTEQHLLVYNPTEDGKNDRSKLNLAISQDGKNWTDIYELENQLTGEFSYPAMIQTKDGLIHITYTWKRQKVRHVVLRLST